MKNSFVELDRRFLDVTSSDPDDDPQGSLLLALNNEKSGYSWSHILGNHGTVILGTAGSGKTTELLSQAVRSRAEGKPAFVLRLENLCRGPVSKAFSPDDVGGEASFEAWLKSKDEAIVFLDALDEARLPDARDASILNDALVNLSEGIGNRSRKLRIVLTTRPSEWHGPKDLSLLKARLQSFKQADPSVNNPQDDESHVQVRLYRIAELDEHDIRRLVKAKDIDPDRFLSAINQGLSADIVRQPLDVEFLTEIWTEQINNGLEPERIFYSRRRIFELFVQKRVRDENIGERRSNLDPIPALRAAEKLAAGLVVSDLRDLTLGGAEESVNASYLLNNDQDGWNNQKLRQLMSTGLFQPSLAGRIRFAHRELQDYLAARFFDRAILRCGGSLDPIEPLIAKGLGTNEIPQSAEKTLGWLATFNPVARKYVIASKPSLLIESGDPTSLSLEDRERTLRHHVSQYEERRYRGEWFYHDDIRKFTDGRLHAIVAELLGSTQSPEARDFLLEVVQYGKMREISDVLATIASDQNEPWRTRAHACNALLSVEDTEFGQPILKSALVAPPPDLEDIDSAPNWNFFLASVLRHCCATDCLRKDTVEILSRFRREPRNLSSITPHIMIEFASNIQDAHHMLAWLDVLMRLVSGERNEQQYRLPRVVAQFTVFTPAIAELTRRVIALEKENLAKDLVLDAVEFLLQFDDDISFLKRKTPLRALAVTLRKRVDVKAALIDRRVRLFDPEGRKDDVASQVFLPLDFDRVDEAPSLFTLDDVRHHCEQMGKRPAGRKHRLAFDIAWNCSFKIKDRLEQKATLEALRRAARKSSDATVRKRYPGRLISRINRLKYNIRHAWRYGLDSRARRAAGWPRDQYWKIRNLSWFYWNQHAIAFGDRPNVLLNFSMRTANEPGKKTILKIERKYGKHVSEWCARGYRKYWRKHDLLPEQASTYWETTGLVGLSLEALDGSIEADELEASRAFSFAYANLNTFPDWCEDLVLKHPDVFIRISKEKILSAFDDRDYERQHSHNDISKIACSSKRIRDLLAPVFIDALLVNPEKNLRDLEVAVQIITQANNIPCNDVLPILLQGYEDAFIEFRISESWIWLDAIFQVDADGGWKRLVASLGSNWNGAAAKLFIRFLGRDRYQFFKPEELSTERFDLRNNAIALRNLVRASYLCCPPADDPKHEDVFSPGIKDRASERRSFYLDALTGQNSADALRELRWLIADPTLTEFRDTFLYERDMLVRRSARRPTYSQEDTRHHLDGISKTPSTIAEFRDLVRRHLSALLFKLEHSDDDESYVFRRGDGKEDDLRNWFAARLREVGNEYYSVTREQEVSREKRPDLRIDARDALLGQIPVEMKLADKEHWKGATLLSKIETQLANQYLKEPASHSGFYMLVNASHPKESEIRNGKVVRKRFEKKIGRKAIGFLELVDRAKNRAQVVTENLSDGKVVEICWADFSE